MPSVTCGVGHDKSGAAFRRECRVELLDPDEVAIVSLGQTEGETLVPCKLILLDFVDVERRIGHDEVKCPDSFVRILVITIGLTDVTGQTVQGKIHLCQWDGVLGLLSPEKGQLTAGFLVVALNELRALHEHTARTAGRVEHSPLEGLQDLDDETHDRVRGEVLTAALSFLGSKVGEKILVDEPKRAPLKLLGQWGKQAKEFNKGRALKLLIPAWQDILEFWVVILDALDRVVSRLADVLPLWQVHQVR